MLDKGLFHSSIFQIIYVNNIVSLSSIPMSHWRHTMVDGTKFWISYQWLAFLSVFCRWHLIQNSAPSTIMCCQCDIWIRKILPVRLSIFTTFPPCAVIQPCSIFGHFRVVDSDTPLKKFHNRTDVLISKWYLLRTR